MKRAITLTSLILIAVFNLVAQPTLSGKQPFVLGESLSFFSNILKEERSINVYLPPGYHPDSADRYPVFYLLDGSADEDFIHVAGLIQFTSFPWVKTLPPVILVGIANTDRKRDFTFPTRNKQDLAYSPSSGGSAMFIRFLAEELKPITEKHYRTTGTSTLIGQSLGGLLAAETLITKPELFTDYIIISPSLWWDDESLLAQKLANPTYVDKKIWIGVGNEGDIMVNDARALHKKLTHSYTTAQFEYLEGHDHANILHLALYKALSQLYAPPAEAK